MQQSWQGRGGHKDVPDGALERTTVWPLDVANEVSRHAAGCCSSGQCSDGKPNRSGQPRASCSGLLSQGTREGVGTCNAPCPGTAACLALPACLPVAQRHAWRKVGLHWPQHPFEPLDSLHCLPRSTHLYKQA